MNETTYVLTTATIGVLSAFGSWGILVASVFGVEI